ncbi:MAG: septum formation initiator family protein [Bacteroidaceae bacterium]|nr:septum formation initiator family protein [Bacteroidaceae bacterium]
MGRLLTIWNFIARHKYAATLLIFVLIIGVVDENSFWLRYERNKEIATLKREIERYQTQYDTETAQLEALTTDPAAVERMAREVYLMKRDNEDLYVFRDVDPSQIQSRKHVAPVAVEPKTEAVAAEQETTGQEGETAEGTTEVAADETTTTEQQN